MIIAMVPFLMNTIPQEDTQYIASTKLIAFSFGKKNKISKAKNLKERIVRKLIKEALVRRGTREKMSQHVVEEISCCKNKITLTQILQCCMLAHRV